jgi:tRNA modification GTPase
MDLDGLPVTLLDTAGLRDSDDDVESIGISRAIERAQNADLRVFLASPGDSLMISPSGEDIVVTPKVDLLPASTVGISGKTGVGIPELIAQVQSVLAQRAASVGLATHLRHRKSLEQAATFLDAAFDVLDRGPDQYDIAAEELRSAIRALEALVGRIDVENLLDEIFANFCLGK